MALTEEEKNSIKANLDKIPVKEIAKYLLDEDFTLQELRGTGNFASPKQKEVEKAIWDSISEQEDFDGCNFYITTYPQGNYINQAQNKINELKDLKAERDFWLKCTTDNTLEGYRNYLNKYPQGKYLLQANSLIEAKEKEQKKDKEKQIKNELKENPNKYSVDVLIYNDFTPEKLKDIIPDEVLETWNEENPIYDLGESPDDIPEGMTEVYFWGVPGSGKSCALAAILSQANKRGLYDPIMNGGNKNQGGRQYMSQLANLFSDDVGILSDKGTQVETTNYLPFNLRDTQGKKHSLALIEISGEIFEAIYFKEMKGEYCSSKHQATYEKLISYLTDTKNRKYHFFVIDVTSKKKDEKGVTQREYLHTAAAFFKDKEIFNNMTADINILVTKSDLLADEKSDREREAIKLLNKDYLSLIQSLKEISKDILKTDQIRVIPFSIGKVYLVNRCIFDPDMSNEVIKILQENTVRNAGKNYFSFFNK